jgi:hypothetical protein
VTVWFPQAAPRLVAGAPAGSPPGAPTNVTSITKDSGAMVSFLAPASPGSGPVTSWTVTPYASGVAQPPTTATVAAAGSITGSNGNTYVQVSVTGLTNSTAYTFTAKASNAYGTGPESAQSGANTPLSGMVFGDDFNGSAGGPVDPEWWIYTRCGYLAQNEVEYYLPSQCQLDGNSNLALTAQHTSHTGPTYPSYVAGGGASSITQPWISGACQSNTRTYAPSVSTNTMTFQTRMQVMADAGNGFWPSFWLEGSHYLTAWKTDPQQSGWDTTTQAEIDVNEWPQFYTATDYATNVFCGGNGYQVTNNPGVNLAQAFHTYAAAWKPGVRVQFSFDGSVTGTDTTEGPPASGAQFFLLIYLQMLAGGPTTTESILVDYVRVFDQNLG